MRWNTLLLAFVGFGAATASPNTTGTFETAMGWDLTQRAEVEELAAWFVMDEADSYTEPGSL